MLAPPLLRSRFSAGAASDAVSRLASLAHDLAGTADDLTLTFSHNPAGQIVGNTRSNDLYSVGGLAAGTVVSAVNGLNQLVAQGGAAIAHDANGNLTSDGTNSYAYSSENLLTGAGGVTLRYDPLMRLAEVADGSTVRFAYDGVDRIADYDANGVLVRRYVHGPGMDEPLVWYVGSDVVYRRWLHADERGSIVAASVNAGTALATRAYDEYGNSTGQGDVGPFRYTGQAWVPEAGLYHYKARMYAPELGRFVQTDPIGYWDGLNLYAYVRGDPVNFVDPLGLTVQVGDLVCADEAVAEEGVWRCNDDPGFGPTISIRLNTGGGGSGPSLGGGGGSGVIVVTGKRLRPQSGTPHRYDISVVTQCSADSAFGAVRAEGNSAPGAPYARSGTHDLTLAPFGDPITQTVDPDSRTITNVTRPGHRFHPGTVRIQVNDFGGGYSSINITGTGSGANPAFNNLVGGLIFGSMAYAIEDYCAAKNGATNIKN